MRKVFIYSIVIPTHYIAKTTYRALRYKAVCMSSESSGKTVRDIWKWMIFTHFLMLELIITHMKKMAECLQFQKLNSVLFQQPWVFRRLQLLRPDLPSGQTVSGAEAHESLIAEASKTVWDDPEFQRLYP